MSRRRLVAPRVSAIAVVALVAACLELSAPQEDLASLSPIAVAWPSVVVGDVLRDMAGIEAPLHLEAYDGDGNLLSDATVNFIVLDQGLSVDSRGVVQGVAESSTPVRIVAQVRRGDDVIQTPEITVDVVPRPDSTEPSKDVAEAVTPVTPTDVTPTIPLKAMAVKVISRASSPPKGVKS